MVRTIIRGVGGYVPERVVTNKDLEKHMDTSDEWIRERTGIQERRWVTTQQNHELGLEASRMALDKAGIGPQDVDLILYATLSMEYTFPGSGVLLQEKLGCRTIGALDIRNQCSGFLYGLAVADGMIRSGLYRNVLLVGAEVHSTRIDLSTLGRDVAVLFGDGAGAVVLGPGEDDSKGLLSVHLHSEGKHHDLLWIEGHGSLFPHAEQVRVIQERRHLPQMDGRQVFVHAVRRMPEVLQEALQANGLSVQDVDLLLPHQANLRINQKVAATLGIPESKVVNNIQKYGNTTAATIPLCLWNALDEGRVQDGHLLAMVAFGSGFTWASALYRW